MLFNNEPWHYLGAAARFGFESLQAQILIPIAISICFGLLASTVLVLLVIPSLYVVLHDFGLTTYEQAE